MVTVHSKPGCVACIATTKELDRLGVEYSKVDVTKDFEAFERISNLGYKQLPVVTSGASHFSGFQPDLLKLLGA